MKTVKLVLTMAMAFCLYASADAQTTKTKKAVTKKHVHSAKYQCPMKCEGDKTYSHAGKCPVCNMQMKKLPAHAVSADAYQCPMKCEGQKTYAKEGKCPVCNMQMKKLPAQAVTATTYQCPMKCEGDKTYTAAGKCPVCKMDLKKIETKKVEEHNHN